MNTAGYQKLLAWQKADELAFQVYGATKGFPKEEIYGVTSQLRRAVLSVPTNIVEGYGRHGRSEFRRFVNIALGSLAETKYLLSFCARLKYIEPQEHERLDAQSEEVGRLLWKFYESLRRG
jgi:four helix bundle protein